MGKLLPGPPTASKAHIYVVDDLILHNSNTLGCPIGEDDV